MSTSRRTALRRYARLDAEGLWRPSADAAPRRVGVSLGEASLTLETGGRAVAHWALPALERHGTAEPARYAPAGGEESLEIADPEMVAAIERVRRALARGRPRRPWGRAVLPIVILAAVAASVPALPGLLRDRAVAGVPLEARVALAERLIDRLGRRCAPMPALDAMAARLAPAIGGASRIVAVDGPAAPIALPGGVIVVPPGAVTRSAEPDVAAGRVLAAAAAGGPDGALGDLLRHAGTWGDRPPHDRRAALGRRARRRGGSAAAGTRPSRASHRRRSRRSWRASTPPGSPPPRTDARRGAGVWSRSTRTPGRTRS